MQDKEHVGIFIREMRQELGITQKELAEGLYVTSQAVSKWERGISYPDIAVLEQLADLLGVSLIELTRAQRNQEDIVMNEATKELVNETIIESEKSIAKLRRRSSIALGIVIAVICCIPLFMQVFSIAALYLIDGAADLEDAAFGLVIYTVVGGTLFLKFSLPILGILGVILYWRKKGLTIRHMEVGNRVRTIICEVLFFACSGWLLYNVGRWIWNAVYWG